MSVCKLALNGGHTTEVVGAGNSDALAPHTLSLTGLKKEDFGFPSKACALLWSEVGEEITGIHCYVVCAIYNTSLAVTENTADEAVTVVSGAELLKLVLHLLCGQVLKDVHIKAKPFEYLLQSIYER